MISRIQVLHYRALKYIDVKLSNFLILVGPNASGKSTFLDVLNLIKDVLNNSPHVAVEKRASRFDELLWKQQGNKFEIAIDIEIPQDIQANLKDKDFSLVRYEISLQSDSQKGVVIGGENLWLTKGISANLPDYSNQQKDQMALFPREPQEPVSVFSPRRRTPAGWRKIISKSAQGNDYFRSETTDWNIIYKFGPAKASLARMPEDEERFPVSLWIKNILIEGIQFLQLNSSMMRWPCRPDSPVAFQTDGSNLPKVIQYLRKEEPKAYALWIKHIQSALPEINKIEV